MLATFVVTNTEDAGPGSLRQAILDANTTAVPDQIHFNIRSDKVSTIAPKSPLPAITSPVLIDGYTQKGAVANTDPVGFNGKLMIELNGSGAGTSQSANGLRISGGRTTIRGLIINRFHVNGILVDSLGGNRIEGNFLGTDVTGTVALGNEDGVDLESGNNIVGGTTPAARNVISGNLYVGVDIDGVGGFNRVQGNLIGTTASGTHPLGNADAGIDISVVNGNVIGGTVPGAGNVIAHNGNNGVIIRSGVQNSVLGNSIHANGLLGIDLSGDGVTPNDSGDGDDGPNNLQNYPVLVSAVGFADRVEITGSLDAAPSVDFRIEFFANYSADPSGYGEGRRPLGATVVTTDGSGHVLFNYDAAPLGDAVWITATATLLDDGVAPASTSEFSAAISATTGLSADLSVVIADTPDPVVLGQSVTYTVTVTNQGPSDATGVVVTADTPDSAEFTSITVPVGNVPYGESRWFQMIVTPRAPGTFTVAASVVGIEDDPNLQNNLFIEHTTVVRDTTIQLEAAAYEVSEGEPYAVLTVRRTGDLSESASVDFRTVSGTAGRSGFLSGTLRQNDFTTTSGTLLFRTKSNVATIRVPIHEDSQVEGLERFQVVLSNPSENASLGSIAAATVTIVDNDPSISFATSSSETSERGRIDRMAAIDVLLSNEILGIATVAYSVVGGTATVGQDFQAQSGIITFLPRQTKKSIALQILQDEEFEGDETVIIELSDPTNGFLGTTTRHRVTIVDDDLPPPPTEPGANPATALAIDLATLPRQSYHESISLADVDTYRVELGAKEFLALDVDPVGVVSTLPSSKLVILGEDGQTVLANVGASAEPENGQVTNNPAYLFQADADGGTYYIQLSTSATGRGFGYSLSFHRIGVSSEVPNPELLNVPGSMYAWFDGVDTVGITGPTGYGFTLTAPWQQTVLTSGRTVLVSQTLKLPAGSRLTLKSPQGVELPLIAGGPITIATKPQRWGNIVGAVSTAAIDLPVALAIAPINDLIADVIGSEFLAFGVLSGHWLVSLGASVLYANGQNSHAPVDEMLAGIPYLRQKGPIKMSAQFGPVSLDYSVVETPIDWIFDPGDPMLYVKADQIGQVKQAALAISPHGLLEFRPQDAPNPLVDAGVTEFYGHVYATAKVPFKIGPLPMEVDAEVLVNVDADRDGKLLGDLRDVDDLFDVLEGDFSEVREILNDLQFGANGTLVMSLKSDKEGPLPPNTYTMEAGRASVVVDGLEETIWVRGQQGGNVLSPDFLKRLNTSSSVVIEGLVRWDGDFLLSTTTSFSIAGINLEYGIAIRDEGIFAHVSGSIKWSVKFDYGIGQVSGTAIATFEANLAIEFDDDGDVYLSGSISATGELRFNGNRIFKDSIDGSIRRKGLRFPFPRGVGNIDFDLFD